MIRQLTGTLALSSAPTFIVDVQGVGYEVQSATLTGSVGDKISCSVYTVVREDALLLYGFRDEKERGLFVLLLSVNGVGPKSALNIVGSLSVKEITDALHRSDPTVFAEVKGIGKKGAERIVLDLSGSINRQESNSEEALTVASALENLGYTRREYKNILVKLPDTSLEEQVAWALKELAH